MQVFYPYYLMLKIDLILALTISGPYSFIVCIISNDKAQAIAATAVLAVSVQATHHTKAHIATIQNDDIIEYFFPPMRPYIIDTAAPANHIAM